MPSPSVPERLDALIRRARDEDGQPPFSDAALVELRTGERELLEIGAATALLSATSAEFVVDPAARGHGLGTAMLEKILERLPNGPVIWAHGDHPAARALAASHALTPVRTLLQLRATVGGRSSGQNIEVEPFRPGLDDRAWVELNARAFAFHPEQGSVSLVELHELMREAWFDPQDFLMLREGSETIGFCWLKVEGDIGEFYVVGVDPERQGEGLGRRLMDAGFARLADRGIRTAALYVESDNAPARGLYRALGFTDHSVDVQYARA